MKYQKLKDHLVRQGIEFLRPHLGQDLFDLLKGLGSEVTTAAVMADILIATRGAGTILRTKTIRAALIQRLNDDEVSSLSSVLGIQGSVPRVTLQNFPFDRQASASTLFEWYGIAFDSQLLSETSSKVHSSAKFEKYQQLAYRELRTRLQDVAHRTLLHMPYGSGKLRVVVTAVLDMFRVAPDDGLIVWVAPDRCLCEEAVAEIELLWASQGTRDVTVYRLFEDSSRFRLRALKGAIAVIDIHSFLAQIAKEANEKGEKPDEKEQVRLLEAPVVTLIFADAEHICVPEVMQFVQATEDGGVSMRVIGMSAAPGVVDNTHPRFARVSASYGEVIQIAEPDPSEALRLSGIVDPVEIHFLNSPVGEILGTDNEVALSEAELEKLASDLGRNTQLLLKISEIAQSEERVIFYATTANQAKTFSQLLSLRGTLSLSVTGEMASGLRTSEISKFSEAKLQQVLCVHGALISAREVDGVNAVIIALPTMSEALLHQMIGRLATGRGSPARPLKIFAVADAVPRYMELIRELTRETAAQP